MGEVVVGALVVAGVVDVYAVAVVTGAAVVAMAPLLIPRQPISTGEYGLGCSSSWCGSSSR